MVRLRRMAHVPNHIGRLAVAMRYRRLMLVLAMLTLGCQGPSHLPQPQAKQSRTTNNTSSNYNQSPAVTNDAYTPAIKGSGIVVIDAGHGGHDPGTLGLGGKNLPEKTVVLDIAKNLERQLKQRGVKVVMTRSGDSFVELDDRAALADKVAADLLISIHIDAHSDRQIGGVSIYTARQPFRSSQRLASKLLAAFNGAAIETRGIRQADYRVLTKHGRPSVLVECGYATNSSDASKLQRPDYRAQIASAMANGILAYLGR